MAHERDGVDPRDALRRSASRSSSAPAPSPRPTGAASRHFLTRREPGQQFSVLYVVDADGTERVLIDPIAIDPSGVTTLDSWQPSKEGDRIAYQLSVGGNEESLLYVMDVATGETIEGPIDRCRYSPVAWLLGGPVVLLRAADRARAAARVRAELPPSRVPPPRRRVARDRRSLVFGAGRR